MLDATVQYVEEKGILQVVDAMEMIAFTLDEDMEQVDFSTMSNEERIQYLYDNYPEDMEQVESMEYLHGSV